MKVEHSVYSGSCTRRCNVECRLFVCRVLESTASRRRCFLHDRHNGELSPALRSHVASTAARRSALAQPQQLPHRQRQRNPEQSLPPSLRYLETCCYISSDVNLPPSGIIDFKTWGDTRTFRPGYEIKDVQCVYYVYYYKFKRNSDN